LSKNLLIVESPAKKKTIQSYLGKDFLVESSVGHIRDLPKKGNKAIDIENGFAPNYVVSEDKKKIVKELQKCVKGADTIWLATDEDREGEAIAWHLTQALDVKNKKINRIVFNEITKEAIHNAIKKPKKINENLVNAQQARRVLDRLVGFELSPLLWKKIKRGLSAGRVQSVAVRLIVERENEINKFESSSSFKIISDFKNENGEILTCELNQKLDDIKNVREFLINSSKFQHILNKIEKKPSKKSPQAAFTTSTLQQEASRKLSFSVNRTMSVAQKLYEQGKITYMRTDSTNLSKTAVDSIKDLVANIYGSNFFTKRTYKSKTKGAQEAHEAIRPTDFTLRSIDNDNDQNKLYRLIWERAVASQMSDAQIERTTYKINSFNSKMIFQAKGEVVTFPGFLAINNLNSDSDTFLPKAKISEKLNLESLKSDEVFAKPPPRYNEASLVRKLEDLGIGRPSTYASTITTVQKRNYILKENREGKTVKSKVLTLNEQSVNETTVDKIIGVEKNKLFPTDIGEIVTKFLVKHFSKILDYSFTATVEDEFDLIAEGKKVWNEMIENFYSGFISKVNDVNDNEKRESGERVLGNHPETNEIVVARLGPFGPMVQIGEKSDKSTDKKPRFASLQKGQTIQNISLEKALELFKLPRSVGYYNDDEIVAAIGRFGPYVKYKNKFYSLKGSEYNPLSISIEEAKTYIENKIQQEKDRIINFFDGEPSFYILNGRYGPFVQVVKKEGKKINLRIPKDTEPKSLKREDCVQLLNKKSNS
tara:strand:+ start:21020 stop:23317 length:2298 start_codon:yes stop_codon:yes gene_type:complete